jgi:hypothetical protein
MEKLPHVEVIGPHQTRPSAWPPELTAFADALEAVLGKGDHDLKAIVAGLNAHGSKAPDGTVWTEASLRVRLKELGG